MTCGSSSDESFVASYLEGACITIGANSITGRKYMVIQPGLSVLIYQTPGCTGPSIPDVLPQSCESSQSFVASIDSSSVTDSFASLTQVWVESLPLSSGWIYENSYDSVGCSEAGTLVSSFAFPIGKCFVDYVDGNFSLPSGSRQYSCNSGFGGSVSSTLYSDTLCATPANVTTQPTQCTSNTAAGTSTNLLCSSSPLVVPSAGTYAVDK